MPTATTLQLRAYFATSAKTDLASAKLIVQRSAPVVSRGAASGASPEQYEQYWGRPDMEQQRQTSVKHTQTGHERNPRKQTLGGGASVDVPILAASASRASQSSSRHLFFHLKKAETWHQTVKVRPSKSLRADFGTSAVRPLLSIQFHTKLSIVSWTHTHTIK